MLIGRITVEAASSILKKPPPRTTHTKAFGLRFSRAKAKKNWVTPVTAIHKTPIPYHESPSAATAAAELAASTA
ncbi:MAG: hypothetical protein RL485_927 [Bacteroidota bacterium]